MSYFRSTLGADAPIPDASFAVIGSGDAAVLAEAAKGALTQSAVLLHPPGYQQGAPPNPSTTFSGSSTPWGWLAAAAVGIWFFARKK